MTATSGARHSLERPASRHSGHTVRIGGVYDLRRVDVRLEIGGVEEAVEVVAASSLIETATGRISDAKDARALKTLPLNTRQLWDYLSLTPGVVQAGAGSATRRFAGSRANQSDASIDGSFPASSLQPSAAPQR